MNIEANPNNVGQSVEDFAGIVMGTVIAGELSLMSVMINSELVSSHIRLNRK